MHYSFRYIVAAYTMPTVTTKTTTTTSTTQTTVHINNKSLVRRYLFSYFPVTRTSPPFRSRQRRRLCVVVYIHSLSLCRRYVGVCCVYATGLCKEYKTNHALSHYQTTAQQKFPLCSMVFFFLSFFLLYIYFYFLLFI